MNYESHLQDLRETYFRLHPHQRASIARQRLENPGHGPNLLVTYVSAVEGLLRSLVIWEGEKPESPSTELYESYRRATVKQLYSKYLEQRGRGCLVGEETYQLVSYAVKYRNHVIHECTYLGQDKFPQLIDACDRFLKAICANENIKFDDS